MDYPVRIEQVAPRDLAAAWGSSTSQIISLLDQVWPVLRQQGVRVGHNVVVYPGGQGRHHGVLGDYTQMRPAYAALERWCTTNARTPAGISWEVYGDPDPDPARCRTDIFFLLRAS